MGMEYPIVFNDVQYYAEVHIIPGSRGNSTSPPEPPTVEVENITNEDGESISDELFDEMEEYIVRQVLAQEVGWNL